MSLGAKAMKAHKLFAEEFAIKGRDIIDNCNVTFSNLWQGGIHIGVEEAKKSSDNVSKFINWSIGRKSKLQQKTEYKNCDNNHVHIQKDIPSLTIPVKTIPKLSVQIR